MTAETPEPTAQADRSLLVLQLLRSLCHLIVVVMVAVWAFTDWQLPWPGLLTGIGFTLLAVLIWALFLSPRPVLHTDRFGHGLIELLFIASGVGALLAIGAPWFVAVIFGIVAAVVGYLVPARLRD